MALLRYSLIILFTFFAINSTVLASKDPITKFISIESPIASGTAGNLSLPNDWLEAHIKCVVTNLLPDDRFVAVTKYDANYNRPVVSNKTVDGITYSDYFEITKPGQHIFEFDIIGDQAMGVPLPQNIQIYNASTEPLAFGNCTATSR